MFEPQGSTLEELGSALTAFCVSKMVVIIYTTGHWMALCKLPVEDMASLSPLSVVCGLLMISNSWKSFGNKFKKAAFSIAERFYSFQMFGPIKGCP